MNKSQKLTYEQVNEIRKSNSTIYGLAKKYGVNRGTIRNILNGKIYSYLLNKAYNEKNVLQKPKKKRLTFLDVIKIKSMCINCGYLDEGFRSKSEMAKSFGISRVTMHAIQNGTAYPYLTLEFLKRHIVECREAVRLLENQAG